MMLNKLTRALFVIGVLLFGLVAGGQAGLQTIKLGTPPDLPNPLATEETDEDTALFRDGDYHLHVPIVLLPPSWISTANREESLALFRSEYQGTAGVDRGWTGNHEICDAGETSPVYRAAMLRRINYFRSMAGVPNVKRFDDDYNSKAQAAALMMSVNNDLSHWPPSDWKCFTEAGEIGAGSSNLALGYDGTDSISQGYMEDGGINNFPVGHRRWILFPATQVMGTGDVSWSENYSPSNALWVFDLEHMYDPRPNTRDVFVAWPPPGYVPYQVVYPRWSFSYPDADLGQTTVSMNRGGQAIDVSILSMVNGFGENTLVWEPQIDFFEKPTADISYQVYLNHVIIDDQVRNFAYTVIIFDPNR